MDLLPNSPRAEAPAHPVVLSRPPHRRSRESLGPETGEGSRRLSTAFPAGDRRSLRVMDPSDGLGAPQPRRRGKRTVLAGDGLDPG